MEQNWLACLISRTSRGGVPRCATNATTPGWGPISHKDSGEASIASVATKPPVGPVDPGRLICVRAKFNSWQADHCFPFARGVKRQMFCSCPSVSKAEASHETCQSPLSSPVSAARSLGEVAGLPRPVSDGPDPPLYRGCFSQFDSEGGLHAVRLSGESTLLTRGTSRVRSSGLRQTVHTQEGRSSHP